jgi:hypothetical protein
MIFCRSFSYDWDQGVEGVEFSERFWKKFRTPPKVELLKAYWYIPSSSINIAAFSDVFKLLGLSI